VKLSYSSLAAFVAHYQILKRAAELTGEERERLAEIDKLLESLAPADREAIESGGGRRNERALRDLNQLLARRGVLCG
jgi:hypothetical protein